MSYRLQSDVSAGLGRNHNVLMQRLLLVSYDSVFPGGWGSALYLKSRFQEKPRRTLGSSLIASWAPWTGRERESAAFQRHQLLKLRGLSNTFLFPQNLVELTGQIKIIHSAVHDLFSNNWSLFNSKLGNIGPKLVKQQNKVILKEASLFFH